MFKQPEGVALVREPGERRYGGPAPVSDSAARLWEYAVLSANVYHGQWERLKSELTPSTANEINKLDNVDPEVKVCLSNPRATLPLDGWDIWPKFPSETLRMKADELGLFVEVWENSTSPQTIAVVFRGTEFDSVPDWRSNLRWFARFIPNYEDQYTLLAKYLGVEFVEEIVERKPQLKGGGGSGPIRVVATGHSLGGGLAQHFAYSLPLNSKGIETPRVSHVYAFDPSLVTGWYSVENTEQRDRNAERLEIDRVFEHGEVLAYFRLLQSYVFPPAAANPAIREIRYNFVRSANIIASHSILQLACNLAHVAGQARRVETEGTSQ